MKRKLDLMSIIGLGGAIILIVFSIMLAQTKGDDGSLSFEIIPINLMSFFDLPSIAIVIGGVLTVLMLSFPVEQFTRVPKHMKIIFAPQQFVPEQYISILVDCAKKARVNGLLALEEDANAIEDVFLKNSLQMIVDSIDPDKVKTQMESWVNSVEERHIQERAFYDKGAAYGPAFGMIGTLIGLINMLKVLDDVASVGPSMSVALVTTFYGSLLANVFFMPVSNKLRVRHDEEYLCMLIVCEGIQAIQSGENPKLIEDKLVHLLPEYRQVAIRGSEDGEGVSGGKKAKKKAK
ncbi:MAG: motility protein A [Clostridiales bacterium]|nr:motility protein A [Clostridiales bacterium]